MRSIGLDCASRFARTLESTDEGVLVEVGGAGLAGDDPLAVYLPWRELCVRLGLALHGRLSRILMANRFHDLSATLLCPN